MPQTMPAPPQTEPAPVAQPAPPEAKPETPASVREGVDPKWLDRLPKEDRAALDELIGYAPPAFTSDVKWFGCDPTDWGKLRGKVIVIQSWTTANTGGRGWPMRIAAALKDMNANDMQIIALHTPEKADGAEDFMKRQKPPESVAVVIDPVGAFCDALAIYKHPVNVIVDRNGSVRYAGLNLNGVKEAAAKLVAEPFDAKAVPKERTVEKPPESAAQPQYPPTNLKVTGAIDLRGKKAPDFACERWYTQEHVVAGRPVVLTFWSKDDAKRLPSHDRLNALENEFNLVASIVMMCEENKSGFEESILRRNEDKNDFNYGVALDRQRTMAGAMNVTTTPYTFVIGKDWVVRWQGRTSDLKSDVVQQVIDADAAAAPSAMGASTGRTRPRWVQ